MLSDLHRCISLLRGMLTSIFFQEKVNFLKDYLTTSYQKTSTLLHFSNSDLFYLSSIDLSIIYLYHIYSIFIISFYLYVSSLSLITPIPYSFRSITPFSQYSCCSSLLFSPQPIIDNMAGPQDTTLLSLSCDQPQPHCPLPFAVSVPQTLFCGSPLPFSYFLPM